MNREWIIKNWNILEAIRDGRAVQFRSPFLRNNQWTDSDTTKYDFVTIGFDHEYRVKPEPVKLRVDDKICNEYGDVYTMFSFYIDDNLYLVPVKVNNEGEFFRLIEPIQAAKNEIWITLDQVNEKCTSSGTFSKIER